VREAYHKECNVSANNVFFLFSYLQAYLLSIFLLLARSAWSRADTPVIEIGDFGEKESMDYLDKRKIDKTVAKELYELVGGRIVDLNSVADKVLEGLSYEGMFDFNICI